MAKVVHLAVRRQDLQTGGSRLPMAVVAVGIVLSGATAAQAQQAGNDHAEQTATESATQAAMRDIVVTATKRGAANVQNVPAAITAFGESQLRAFNFRDLQSLSYKMPNVQLESIGTSPGYANFSIRGLGLNNTQLTLEPTVGIFVDGIYQGVSAGMVFDNFDIEGVEVLRGPQGLLFGRNVTGGAVLVRTTEPSLTPQANVRIAAETGLNLTTSVMVTGPLSSTVAVKLAAYYNRDAGWFRDEVDGTKVDRARTFVVRPAFMWKPSGDVKLVVRGEHGENRGNGPAVKNFPTYSLDNFKFANDVHGPYSSNWNQATGEANIGVGFGDGTVTNVVGWRKFRNYNSNDADGTVMPTFRPILRVYQEQFSDELRYAGTFGPVKLTTGLFYFWQTAKSVERRLIAPATDISGGGTQRTETLGIFVSADWSVSEKFTLSVGARFNHDKKDADVSVIRPNGCNFTTLICATTYSDAKSWSDLSPRIGFQWQADDELMVYGYYAKGFRSGGFSLRQTSLNSPRTPFDPETQNAFEIGLKGDFFDRRLRLNAAGFLSVINGLQRSVQTSNPTVGLVQVLTNTANAEIKGIEVEARFSVTSNLILSGNLGYTQSTFKKIFFDLTGDGVIDSKDFSLKLPRLSPWAYNISVLHSLDIPVGALSTTVSYSHRDPSYYDDTNVGRFRKADIVDANLSLAITNTGVTISVYGKNLTSEVTTGNIATLPGLPAYGGAGAKSYALNKGRVLGAEVRYQF